MNREYRVYQYDNGTLTKPNGRYGLKNSYVDYRPAFDAIANFQSKFKAAYKRKFPWQFVITSYYEGNSQIIQIVEPC